MNENMQTFKAKNFLIIFFIPLSCKIFIDTEKLHMPNVFFFDLI